VPHKHAIILLVFIVVGVIFGIFSGWYWGAAMVSVFWLGKLFLNALKMTIVPLIAASVISGISSLGDVRKLERLGLVTFAYYIITTSIAVLIGLVMVNLIEPCVGLELNQAVLSEDSTEKKEVGVSDIILSLVSANLIASAADTQLLPIIFFSILFAAALTTLGERSRVVFEFFDGLNEAMMRLVRTFRNHKIH
jgi:Na+/H+-dicarboxylate symporter